MAPPCCMPRYVVLHAQRRETGRNRIESLLDLICACWIVPTPCYCTIIIVKLIRPATIITVQQYSSYHRANEHATVRSARFIIPYNITAVLSVPETPTYQLSKHTHTHTSAAAWPLCAALLYPDSAARKKHVKSKTTITLAPSPPSSSVPAPSPPSRACCA